MNNHTLREKIEKSTKYPGIIFLKNAPVVHRGFPSCFNLSFAEYEMIKNFEGYLTYDHNLIFSKIQPCIRHQDWKTIISNKLDNYRYLSVFDMADISGCIVKQGPDTECEATKFAIKSFVDFIKDIGLDISRLKVSFFAGGRVADVTKDKYNFNQTIGKDPLVNYWIELGLEDSQFVPDSTRDTLLALNIFGLPTPWGYRNEIYYIYDNKEIDIGTVESLRYEPLFENKKIVGLKPFSNTVAISVVGVERLLMILSEKENIWEIETIKPIIDEVLSISSHKDTNKAMILVQALRAIHRIVTDGGLYHKLNQNRKEIIRNFYRELFKSASDLGIDLSNEILKKMLDLNATLQPYYTELTSGSINTIDQINIRRKAFIEDRSIKNRGVAQ